MEALNNQSFMGIPLLAWIPLLPILGAFINLTIGRKFTERTVHTVGIGSVLASFAVVAYSVGAQLWPRYQASRAGGLDAVQIKQVVYNWITVGDFRVDLAFTLDTLSAVMVLVVTFVGTLIHIYSAGYMHGDRRYAAYFGYLNLFTGSMLILVLASSLPVMFIGWEGVGVCSFLLIGFWFENTSYANAGRKAFVVNRIGDFAFLLGMFLLWYLVRDLDFGALRNPEIAGKLTEGYNGADSSRWAQWVGILLFIGACGKSAQIPLYVWLPDAMAGPTPVSALIHAATMVTAGVYMIVRLSFVYTASATAMGVVAVVGLFTALAAAFMAFAQTDLKKVLAYSTVSQLGFMFVAVGTGNWVAAIFHLATHAFFKAGLFLGAGSVMHGMAGSGDITQMGGLRKHMPYTRMVFLIYCLAIAGVPLFSGFFSKDEILAGAWYAHPPDWPLWFGKALWVGLSIAALGTAFYMWRLYFLVFAGEERSETAHHAHESPAVMVVPLVILAGLSVIAGYVGLPHIHATEGLPGFVHFLPNWLSSSLTHSWQAVDGGAEIMGHGSDATTIGLMVAASTIGLLGIGMAWMLYGRGPSPTVAKLVEGPLAKAHYLSQNKLFVDEAYEVAFLRPFRWAARAVFEYVDRFVVDTVLVGGAAFVVSMASRLLRWGQNGQVQRYLIGLVVGAGAMFLVTDCRKGQTFRYETDGASVTFRAMPGEGLVGARARLTWDINNDGAPDTNPQTGDAVDAREVTVPAGDVGSKVTLWIEDPITRKKTAVTRTIRALASSPVSAPAAETTGGH